MTLTKYLFGHLTGFGLTVALVTAAADQGTKLWMLATFKGGTSPVTAGRLVDLLLIPANPADSFRWSISSFIDLVLTWNTGISYGLLQQVGPFGQWALLGVKAIAVLLLWIWLAHATSRLTAVALGLIIGGAIGNAIDRALHGAVLDFVHFHITTADWTFSWYVFNLADAAIVAGVIGLLYESLRARDAAKAP